MLDDGKGAGFFEQVMPDVFNVYITHRMKSGCTF